MSLDIFLRPVVIARPEKLIADAARKPRDHRAGYVVIERGGKAFGIVTGRDVAIRVVGKGLDPATVKAEAVATLDPVVVRDVEGLGPAAWRMREYGVSMFDECEMPLGMFPAD